MPDQSRTLIQETTKLISKPVTVMGWAQTKRDHGKVTFVDLRDRTGVLQCVGFNLLKDVTTESVLEVTGTIKKRSPENVNQDAATGEIELEVESYHILNKAVELPILVEGDGNEVSEEVRLKYRYLDLRRSRMSSIQRLRSDFTRALRSALYDQDFVEIETPMLTKSTKEGARDFIVPSRFQPGKFYALPQSPQQYKQLLMTAGFERYFQVARCIRDEDLRADRGFEFTQLDLEMSFVDQPAVMDTVETMVKTAVKAVGGKLKADTFPVVTYQEAMEQYGEDRFDLRTDDEKQDGTLAFAWVVKFPFFKKVDTADAAEVADGKSGWTFTHNPFSAPLPEYLDDHLNHQNIGSILTSQYDLVCNGYEVGGGSIRAHQPEVLEATFKIMGYSDQQIQDSVGHMLEAFRVGTPPHGGIALGLDRLIMLLAGETSLKEAIAFPMTSSGRTSVMDAPALVEPAHLHELGISVNEAQISPHDYILESLQRHGAAYQYLSHTPVKTSQEAADVRGTSLAQAAKALVLEVDKQYVMLVLPGDQRADLKSFQKQLGAKKVAMASKDSVQAKTGLEVGSIPPFGSSLGLPTYVDARLLAEPQIAFNVGALDRSVVMSTEDYVKIEQPEQLQF